MSTTVWYNEHNELNVMSHHTSTQHLATVTYPDQHVVMHCAAQTTMLCYVTSKMVFYVAFTMRPHLPGQVAVLEQVCRLLLAHHLQQVHRSPHLHMQHRKVQRQWCAAAAAAAAVLSHSRDEGAAFVVLVWAIAMAQRG
jgi:hypothetical protein